MSKGSLEIAKQANLIIQPVRPSLDDLNPAIREFNGLFKSGIPKNKLAFVINAVSSEAEEKATRNYLQKAGYFVFANSLSEKISYREAQNEGKSINFGTPPVEVSENLRSLEIDKRTLRKTNRIHQFNTSDISYEERLKYVEVLEKALECYEKHRNYKNPIRLSPLAKEAQKQLRELSARIMANEKIFQRKGDKIPALPFWIEIQSIGNTSILREKILNSVH
ncbi:4534_t:CDS:2 [Entrophospora sp. SA101]|nr:4521_t:CDS:2 [Entrophospora sp. SA101]CAJ0760367.1 4534_t:CDS:2 [Entrophospora sp. SA101]CAJ0842937.1 13680_t:CDS:2 [Entrophospora sp. SA101]